MLLTFIDLAYSVRSGDDDDSPEHASSTDDLVPAERQEGKGRKAVRHWTFLGFKVRLLLPP